MEHLCGTLETALMRRRWSDLEAAIADSRRVMHALQNAMDQAAPARDETFDAHVMRRLHHVAAIRENQMSRLQQYQDAIGERLQVMARWKEALRSMGRRRRPVSRLASLDVST